MSLPANDWVYLIKEVLSYLTLTTGFAELLGTSFGAYPSVADLHDSRAY
jgi:hypothetical protein